MSSKLYYYFKIFWKFWIFSKKKLHDSPRSRASRFPVFLVGNSQIWINSSISWNITVDFCKVASGIYPPFDNSTIFFYSVAQSSIPIRGMFGAEKSDNIFLWWLTQCYEIHLPLQFFSTLRVVLCVELKIPSMYVPTSLHFGLVYQWGQDHC